MTEGAYLIDRIRDRCVEDGDCLVWTGWVNTHGIPRLQNKSLRRSIFEEMNGPAPKGKVVSPTCTTYGCVAPEHLIASTKGEVLARVYATTNLRARRAVTSRVTGRRNAKLDMEKVRHIRSSDETLDALAERYGVNRTLISQVRRGIAWRDDSNPFAGLGAR